MNKMNSKTLKNEADLLLKKTDLLETLSKYGEVFIRGSYELDLMVDGDVDIYVVNNKLNKELAVKALNELVNKNDFRGYLFYDFVKRRRKGFPKGYYLGAKTRFKNKKWKIDIWFMNEMDKVSDGLMGFVKKNMDEKSKSVILKIKKECKDRKLDVSSHLVYLAVLKKGVKSYSSFVDSLSETK